MFGVCPPIAYIAGDDDSVQVRIIIAGVTLAVVVVVAIAVMIVLYLRRYVSPLVCRFASKYRNRETPFE